VLVRCYLPLSTGTYSIVFRVYVLVLDMYLDYKVPVISILVEMNVMLPPTSVVLIDIVRVRTAAAGRGLVRSTFVFYGCGDGRRCRCAFAGTGAGGRVSGLRPCGWCHASVV
jgi:hypothetical protein